MSKAKTNFTLYCVRLSTFVATVAAKKKCAFFFFKPVIIKLCYIFKLYNLT